VYTLKNAHGIELRVLDYGGIIVSLKLPDRAGKFDDVVLGYDSLAGYERASPYFGALIGRYGNRIARGRFTLDGRTYTLATNNGPNHLHGGARGFDKVVWDVTPFDGPDSVGLILRYTSGDGEEGYPGMLHATVTYTLTNRDELIFDYHATTDRATPVNLTQHSYFNLGGGHSGSRRHAECGPFHPGRFHADPDGRGQERRGHAVRFPLAHLYRRPHRRGGPPAPPRTGL